MKEGLPLKKHVKNKNLSFAFFYLMLFTITSIIVICSCITCFYLNSKSHTVASDLSTKFDLVALSTLKLNTILSQKVIEKKDNINANLIKHEATYAKNPSVETESNSEINSQSSVDYTKLYPNLYVKRPSVQTLPPKTAFLTFDDGPSERTAEILDILKEQNIQATFFVTGKTTDYAKTMMKRIVNEGHTIAVHTYTHNFKEIYASVQDYLCDFNNIYNLIYVVTGVKPCIFRFPGGSKNGFNKDNYREFINEMCRRGFDYFDWNVSAGDAVSRTPTPVSICISNVLKNSANLNACVVLMHDLRPKTTTVKALPEIINGLRAQGFKFDKLSHDINPSSFSLVRPYR